MNFHNRHAIITGGSSGIGRATACLLTRRGAHVSIIARRQELLDETLAELEALRENPTQRLRAYLPLFLTSIINALAQLGSPYQVLQRPDS
jgi:NAD(P)-dependent dehydrogenase (short-subunit alcohol dehydrogenase family)